MPLAAPGDWPVKIREFNSSQTCAEFKSAFYVIRITDITVWSFTRRALSRTTRFQISRDVTCGHPNTVVYTVGFSAAFYSTFSRAALRPPRRVFYVSGCFRIAGYRPPLGSHIFPRHTAPVSLSPTPVSPPRLLRTTAFATHHRVCHTRPRVVVTGPVSPSRLLHTMPRRQRHRRQMCNAVCPPGCATVWCPDDDAVVVHTTRWRGLKSPPRDFHITRRVLDLISRQNFLSDYKSLLFAGLSSL